MHIHRPLAIFTACLAFSSAVARADEPVRWLDRQREEARKAEERERAAMRKESEDAAGRERTLRRLADEQRRLDGDVERAKRRLDAKQREWQRWGDRKAYRRLNSAHEDLLKKQRAREDVAERNRQLVDRDHAPTRSPRVPVPPLAPPAPGLEVVPAPGAIPGPALRPAIPAPPDDPVPAGAQEL